MSKAVLFGFVTVPLLIVAALVAVLIVTNQQRADESQGRPVNNVFSNIANGLNQ